MESTIKVSELKVGMQVVENDGYVLDVISVRPMPRNRVEIICHGATRDTKNIVPVTYNARVLVN